MIKLDTGNVLLKPTHRKQLMTWLRRALRLGSRLGDFVLNVTIRRVGRVYDVKATAGGERIAFDCHARRHDWRTAVRDLVRAVTARVHDCCLRRPGMA